MEGFISGADEIECVCRESAPAAGRPVWQPQGTPTAAGAAVVAAATLLVTKEVGPHFKVFGGLGTCRGGLDTLSRRPPLPSPCRRTKVWLL